jgi:ribosomal protein S18 acetylase RimI-like enzyme
VSGSLLVIRRATLGELASCALLATRVAHADFPWNPREAASVEAFLADAVEDEIFLALLDGSLVGVLAFFRPENFIHTLSVDPAARGRGVGRALVRHVAHDATGPLSLKVETPNQAALAFYGRLGFQRATGADAEGLSPYSVPWVRLIVEPALLREGDSKLTPR